MKELALFSFRGFLDYQIQLLPWVESGLWKGDLS